MRDRYFLDSNILVYAVGENVPDKPIIARNLMSGNVVISSQVIFESLNVCLKKLKLSQADALKFLNDFSQTATIAIENSDVMFKAFELLQKFSLQTFDSKIVATTLLAECDILYSEDLHHGLVIENKLRIVNPFL